MHKILMLFVVALCFGRDFKTTCLKCHETHDAPSLESIYYRHLMLHSSKDRIANKMFEFLSDPKEELSSMPKRMIENFGLHPKTESENLKALIDEYISSHREKTKIEFE